MKNKKILKKIIVTFTLMALSLGLKAQEFENPNTGLIELFGSDFGYYSGTSFSNTGQIKSHDNSYISVYASFINEGIVQLNGSSSFYLDIGPFKNVGNAVLEINDNSNLSAMSGSLLCSDNSRVILGDRPNPPSGVYDPALKLYTNMTLDDSSYLEIGKNALVSSYGYVNRFQGNSTLEMKGGSEFFMDVSTSIYVQSNVIFWLNDGAAKTSGVQIHGFGDFVLDSHITVYLSNDLKDADVDDIVTIWDSSLVDHTRLVETSIEKGVHFLYEDGTEAVGWEAYITDKSVMGRLTQVPEASEFAAFLGLIALGFVAYRRRK